MGHFHIPNSMTKQLPVLCVGQTYILHVNTKLAVHSQWNILLFLMTNQLPSNVTPLSELVSYEVLVYNIDVPHHLM